MPARIAVCLIRGYQLFISPYLGKNCRFHPTCSRYAIESIERFGLIRGGWLALYRIVKCGPWHPGGYDPVPDKTDGPDSRGE
ncbi:membrane protein insertion efficiency factor YidD [Dethiosulfovibrio sp. F2B]|uniref:membrane protein insertion efficiency factor YidD n=1 Tax=Dethiosulfovibrio faecalis TaxID=2720018 RepID=UPI001F19766E|nr:membrane protein insertion efficiency factor YidD [Dethiosulfovibrio faecalis]